MNASLIVRKTAVKFHDKIIIGIGHLIGLNISVMNGMILVCVVQIV